jgi:hypothetical protein
MAARARSRLEQVKYVKTLSPKSVRDEAPLAAILLQTERLADALAEGEFRDMGLGETAGKEALARLIHTKWTTRWRWQSRQKPDFDFTASGCGLRSR